MKKIALLASALLATGVAQAIPISYGTAEYVTVRTCIAGASGCDGISSIIQGAYGGAPGATSSTASTFMAGHGGAAGTVSLSGTVGAPVLHAYAVSDAGARTNTNSVALQRYTYTGATTTTRTFGGTLTYSQWVTGPYPGGVGSGVNAGLSVYTSSASTIEVGSTAQSNFDSLFNVGNEAGFTLLGSDNFTDATTRINGVGTVQVAVTLNPGDSVWVWALLQTPAANQAFVDAAHTFVTGWDDVSYLIPDAVASVPEPATFVLLALGLFGVTVSRRMR